jgi:hypothetical protein
MLEQYAGYTNTGHIEKIPHRHDLIIINVLYIM